jgi:hypothetical protein
MLLKRIAKSNLRQRIKSYFDMEKYEALPENLAAKKAFKSKSKEEILKELIFYAKYCLENTANPDEEFTKAVKELLKKCENDDLQDLQDFLIRLK